MVWVPEDLRRQGIASKMYGYARHTLGLDLAPSDSQSDMGKKLWTKAHESLIEAYNDDTIDAVDVWARRKGFQFMSSGSDARVYTNADRTVILKALVSEHGISPVDAGYGFLAFYNFCKRNPGNPHLPKFISPPRRVMINGEGIIYIEMEMLKHLNKRMESIVEDLISHVDLPWQELYTEVSLSDTTKKMLQEPQDKQLVWRNFYQTLTDLYDYYQKRNPVGKIKRTTVMWDLGGTNIMSRNLVPVITDPFIAY